MGSFPPLTLEPHIIIFYRDGVNEDQLNQVLMHKMDSIRNAYASLEDGCCWAFRAYPSIPPYPEYFLSSHANDFFYLIMVTCFKFYPIATKRLVVLFIFLYLYWPGCLFIAYLMYLEAYFLYLYMLFIFLLVSCVLSCVYFMFLCHFCDKKGEIICIFNSLKPR